MYNDGDFDKMCLKYIVMKLMTIVIHTTNNIFGMRNKQCTVLTRIFSPTDLSPTDVSHYCQLLLTYRYVITNFSIVSS